jgi:hypothetical protein
MSIRQHPTVEVPDVGLMDHAWDALGKWKIELELAERGQKVRGELVLSGWGVGELTLDPVNATDAGLPPRVPLERSSEVERTDVGGGALAWMMHAPSVNWELRTIFWPGDLHVVILDADDDAELFKVRGHRPKEYYLRKYP